jgi:hypothetical protein
MTYYTLAQEAKAVAAQVGAACTMVLAICAYVISEELFDDNVKAWAVAVAGFVGLLGSIATRIATFRIPNAPVTEVEDPLA